MKIMKNLFLICSLFFCLALHCSDNRQEKGVTLEEKLFSNSKDETIFSKNGFAFYQKYIFKEGKLENFEYFGEVQFKTETGTTRTCVLFNITMTVEKKQYHHSFQIEFQNEHIESGFWYYFPLDSQHQ
ncbi:MAG TPA: hypothetical protein PLJ29_06805, partial [Leptospiraceae bacterium]|nr:hypothetical protein [Leptospiraceae bacterium]